MVKIHLMPTPAEELSVSVQECKKEKEEVVEFRYGCINVAMRSALLLGERASEEFSFVDGIVFFKEHFCSFG